MKSIKISLLLWLMVLPAVLCAQAQKPAKVNDVFMRYMTDKLRLKPAEKDKMSPLVHNYLTARRKASKKYTDPLDKEEQLVLIKKEFRTRFAKVIGLKRANSFFFFEQQFRRKVREELRQRNHSRKKD